MDKKTKGDDELLKFVELVEEHKVILSKSQFASIKVQKHDAVVEMIQKWTVISGKELTETTLMKKLHNMKTRANLAAEKNVLTEWQRKLLELIGPSHAGNVLSSDDESVPSADECATPVQEDSGCASSVQVEGVKKRKAEAVLKELETEQTKYLSNDELQRYLLLKHVKLVDLQIQKLEKEKDRPANEGNVLVDYVEWNDNDNLTEL